GRLPPQRLPVAPRLAGRLHGPVQRAPAGGVRPPAALAARRLDLGRAHPARHAGDPAARAGRPGRGGGAGAGSGCRGLADRAARTLTQDGAGGMHRLLPFQPCRSSWSPRLQPGWVRFWRPFRRLLRRWQENILEVEVRGLEHLREAATTDQGILITPNHFAYADSLILYDAAERVGRALHIMTAAQI